MLWVRMALLRFLISPNTLCIERKLIWLASSDVDGLCWLRGWTKSSGDVCSRWHLSERWAAEWGIEEGAVSSRVRPKACRSHRCNMQIDESLTSTLHTCGLFEGPPTDPCGNRHCLEPMNFQFWFWFLFTASLKVKINFQLRESNENHVLHRFGVKRARPNALKCSNECNCDPQHFVFLL